MPLCSGSSNADVSANIRTLTKEGGRPRAQILAIAMNKAGRSKKRRPATPLSKYTRK